MRKRIVAEVTRNWTGREDDEKASLLSQRFEKVIAVNASRGYELESWKLQTTFIPQAIMGPLLCETIIAVFVEMLPPSGTPFPVGV